MTEPQRHIPVMLGQVIEAMSVKAGGVYVDATFGFGGYTSAILDKADCKVIAIDRDPEVLPRAKEFETKFGPRFSFKAGRFSDLADLIDEKADGIVFDIGVSSMQLDDAERGFSFLHEAKLDMRMSQTGESAYDLVNGASEEVLADILYRFGEEKKSRQIAHRILVRRTQKPIETTTELATVVYEVLGPKHGKGADPATRTFQALRIAVNDELGELQAGLEAAKELLNPDGRLVVVDFHSLEDRIVKNFFKENSAKKVHVSRYSKENVTASYPFCEVSDVILPLNDEILFNPRARSAKMRYAIRSQGE